MPPDFCSHIVKVSAEHRRFILKVLQKHFVFGNLDDDAWRFCQKPPEPKQGPASSRSFPETDRKVTVINAVFQVLHGFSLASPAEEEQEMVVDHFEMQQSKPDAWLPTN